MVINFEATTVIIYMNDPYSYRDRAGKRAWGQISQEGEGLVRDKEEQGGVFIHSPLKPPCLLLAYKPSPPKFKPVPISFPQPA